MNTIGKKLAAVAFVLFAATPAFAGKGGSAERIRSAVQSTSVDAIIAELERAEGLLCGECVNIVTPLLEDNRYAVREVAAWWFAKRPATAEQFIPGFVAELETGSTIEVRNAADFLGATVTYKALPALRKAITRDIGAEGKLAIVRAVKTMGHIDGNPVLVHAMRDGSPEVRAAAVKAYRDIRKQRDTAPVLPLLGDRSAEVRAEAATVAGGMRAAGAVAQLEQLVVNDSDSFVRRNAAWALGRIGSASSRGALSIAAADQNNFVAGVAKAALASLK